MDVQKTVTMASIIEKETAVPEERAVVASVYYNRLARNIASAGRSQRDLCRTAQRKLLRSVAPCRHGVSVRLQHLCSSRTSARARSGIPAALLSKPPCIRRRPDYYYFVSDGNGHHRFSRSLEEHNQNVAKLRQAVQGK